MRKKHTTLGSAIPIVWIISLLCMQSYADFQPERMYKVRKKISLNKGWKFKNDVPTSAPKEATYDDASWAGRATSIRISCCSAVCTATFGSSAPITCILALKPLEKEFTLLR